MQLPRFQEKQIRAVDLKVLRFDPMKSLPLTDKDQFKISVVLVWTRLFDHFLEAGNLENLILFEFVFCGNGSHLLVSDSAKGNFQILYKPASGNRKKGRGR
jgi:hypothetical protein